MIVGVPGLYPQTLDARKVLRETIRAELGVED